MTQTKKHLKLKSPSWVFVDWANVYNWKKSLKRDVDPKKLYKYLKNYPEIENIRFYFGRDKHSKSKAFLRDMKRVGYKVVTKPVKYMLTAKIEDQEIYRRKCDFDMEICMDVHKTLGRGIESFVFFTGDGDFAPLYKMLIGKKKQVIVVYSAGHLGREVWNMKKSIFKVELKNLIKLT